MLNLKKMCSVTEIVDDLVKNNQLQIILIIATMVGYLLLGMILENELLPFVKSHENVCNSYINGIIDIDFASSSGGLLMTIEKLSNLAKYLIDFSFDGLPDLYFLKNNIIEHDGKLRGFTSYLNKKIRCYVM